jgi:hypothetical protein
VAGYFPKRRPTWKIVEPPAPPRPWRKAVDKKIGQAKPDLNGESTAEVAAKAKSLIRTDWGGKDPDEVIRKKMLARGIDAGPQSVQAIREIAEEQVEGCRRRTARRLDEIVKRSKAEAVGGSEKMP